MFSSPHLTLDSDSARLLTELTSAATSDSTDRLVTALADIQAHANPRPGVLVHFQVSLRVPICQLVIKMYLPGGADVPHEPHQQLSEVHNLQPPSQASEAPP